MSSALLLLDVSEMGKEVLESLNNTGNEDREHGLLWGL